jgi:cystathionine beta-lyase/cystathionine gamma-synthase
MEKSRIIDFIGGVLQNLPSDWLNLTTHRLDTYNEELAKTEFLEELSDLFQRNETSTQSLSKLSTAYDYIRLGHPLSCILEWAIGEMNMLESKNVISFSSKSVPILAILRKNHLDNRNTQIIYTGIAPTYLELEELYTVYKYNFELRHASKVEEIVKFEGSTIYISQQDDFSKMDRTFLDDSIKVDFFVNINDNLGSILIVNHGIDQNYISDIQHVRRRETIALTPADCLVALEILTGKSPIFLNGNESNLNKPAVLKSIKNITGAHSDPVVGSSGLSIQYAIMMGLIDYAQVHHKGKAIKFLVPPNCYGGTNDQARRVAECNDNVEIVDLPVDREHDMVDSVSTVLDRVASQDAVPYIIAEIPTNPRVEVPNLIELRNALSKVRRTSNGEIAIDPVFILDQTFCPNVLFLGEGQMLSTVRTISYASGSKFPSGGLCTAGYCVVNEPAKFLIERIQFHLELCDNEATDLQYEILAKQLPSMNQRIVDAYGNTREFVSFIQKTLPDAKINFVSEDLANQGFTPSVFSLDLPTMGDSHEEKETYKRALNHKLIKMMITRIPNESKYCVSYGQLKGCYWTIPATSTQGTTKEGDKDYIARVALSPDLDLDLHKKVFCEFVESIR